VPVVSEMIEQVESVHAPCIARPRNPPSIQAARNCLRIFLALSGFCLALRISAYANAAEKKQW